MDSMCPDKIEERGFRGRQVLAGLFFSDRAGIPDGNLETIERPRWVPETSSTHGTKADDDRKDTGLPSPPASPR